MSANHRTALSSVVLALACVMAAFMIRFALNPWLGSTSPMILFTLAVMLAATRGGLRTGLLATLLSALLGFALKGDGVWTVADSLAVILFLICGVGISVLADRQHASTLLAEGQARKILEQGELINLSHDAIIVRSETGEIRHWNKGAEEMYGWTEEEARQENIDQLLHTKFPGPLEQIIEDLRRNSRWEGELTHTTRSGQLLVVESRWVLSRSATEKTNWVLEINRDVTARLEAEANMRRLYESSREEIQKRQLVESELRRSNEDLRQFAHVVSHDLQEPLRTASGFAELLANRHRNELSPDAQEFVDFIQSSVRRMKKLVEDLLEYSQIAHGPSESAREVNMNAIWRDVTVDLEAAIAANHAVVTTVDLPAVYGVPSRVRQLLQNLISNALKYRSEAPPRISLEVAREGEFCHFTLQDNGVGVPEEHQERIFGVFKRLHGSNLPGTGIGLAICRKIVEQHRGRIWVESTPGAGSTFHFTLPARSSAPIPVPPEKRAS